MLSPMLARVKPSQRVLSGIGAVFAALAVLYLRRGTTLTLPQVWDEDGVILVPDFLQRGWSFLLEPYQAYLLTVSRVVTGTALTIAPHDYPFASTVLAWLFTAAVVAFVATAPLMLRGGLLLGLACLLVPTDPEVFGTPLYAAWWAGIPLLILPFWETQSRHLALRIGVLTVGGLSSPLVAVIAPLLIVRAFLQRTRADTVLAAVAVLCAAVQVGIFLWATIGLPPEASKITAQTVSLTIEKYFGWFVWDTSWRSPPPSGLGLLLVGLAVMAAMLYAARQMGNLFLAGGLLFLLAGSIALSIVRVGAEVLHPIGAGPRYFFYPYIVLGWILISAAMSARHTVGRAAIVVLLGLALTNAASSGWSRDHADIQWARNVASCVHFDDYAMPIEYDGRAGYFWRHTYTREQCTRLGGVASALDPQTLYPFTVRSAKAASDPPVLSPDMQQPVVTLTLQRNARVPFLTSDRATNQRYRLEAGDRTFAGELPICREVCLLEFSADVLPETFTVTFLDEGQGAGDWFAAGTTSAP